MIMYAIWDNKSKRWWGGDYWVGPKATPKIWSKKHFATACITQGKVSFWMGHEGAKPVIVRLKLTLLDRQLINHEG